jgi:hypothetical protein
MKFGIFLPPFHPPGQDPALAYQRDLQLIDWLDELGYDEASGGGGLVGYFGLISLDFPTRPRSPWAAARPRRNSTHCEST